MKKYSFAFICSTALFLFFSPLNPQTKRPLDDRDMFVRYEASNQVMPNIVLLADSSGSMNTVIYHPNFDPHVDYSEGGTNTLSGVSTIFDNVSGNDAQLGTKPGNVKTFKICRGGVTTVNKTARGTYISRVGSTWTVTWDNTSDPFIVGATISFTYSNKTTTDTIKSVNCTGTSCTIGVNGSKYPNGSNKSVSSAYQVQVPNDNVASFIASTGTCGTSAETYTISIWANTEADGNVAWYELNYLNWLAFFASAQDLIDVNHWATTGEFPDPKTGLYVFAGYNRRRVVTQVLTDVVNDTYKTVNYGLFRFDNSTSDGANGALMLDGVSNKNTTGTLSNFITQLSNIGANGSTPLAESMADIWKYFKAGPSSTSYEPNSTTHTSPCGNKSGGSFPSGCPIQYYCQQNFVIVMTDGQSTQDNFQNTKFGTANDIFRQAVDNWGDKDGRDPNYPNAQFATDPFCPMDTCYISGQHGTQYLDDVAYFMRANDMYPDTYFPDMPGIQNICTYTIGLTANNDLLASTADPDHGDGKYYISNNYQDLKQALSAAIYDIEIRTYAFASFTAPKKVTSTVGEGYSYVGFFQPNASDSIWDGYLDAYVITLHWCPDLNSNNALDAGECITTWVDQADCESSNPNLRCLPTVQFGDSQNKPIWYAENIIKSSTRNLFANLGTGSTPNSVFALNDAGQFANLKTLWGGITDAQANTIISTIYEKHLADIFHSDIAFVGMPPVGKTFLANYNPPECTGTDPTLDPNCYQYLYTNYLNRNKVIYAGTNDGVMHQLDANDGNELWGFLPDEILPTLKSTVLGSTYNFTVDGRLTVDDIFYRGAGTSWKTALFFGLRDGGNAYYALDVTIPGTQPTILWKFKDLTYSGKSWGKPQIGKLRNKSGSTTLDRWVVVFAGGMAFNNANPADQTGKAMFVVDASSGELIWMIGFDNVNGVVDTPGTPELEIAIKVPTPGSPGIKHLTKAPEFDYAIPSAVTVVDKDNNGYIDSIYFGNVGGHLFKTDLTASDPTLWKTYLIYKKKPTTATATATVSAVGTASLTLSASGAPFVQNTIFGRTSKAMAVVDSYDTGNNKIVAISPMSSNSFSVGETIEICTDDPIFEAPAVAFDNSYNLWISFGTGDRIRSRTNPTSGEFFVIKDGTTTNVSGNMEQMAGITTDNLVNVTSAWTVNPTAGTGTLADTPVNLSTYWGFYFTYPDAVDGEKLFDPEPMILPDTLGIPHLYFNTFTPVVQSNTDPCQIQFGKMMYYDLTLNIGSSGKVGGTTELGRIAGGGIFGEPMVYVTYVGQGVAGSVPPPKKINSNTFDRFRGAMVFYKENHK